MYGLWETLQAPMGVCKVRISSKTLHQSEWCKAINQKHHAMQPHFTMESVRHCKPQWVVCKARHCLNQSGARRSAKNMPCSHTYTYPYISVSWMVETFGLIDIKSTSRQTTNFLKDIKFDYAKFSLQNILWMFVKVSKFELVYNCRRNW